MLRNVLTAYKLLLNISKLQLTEESNIQTQEQTSLVLFMRRPVSTIEKLHIIKSTDVIKTL